VNSSSSVDVNTTNASSPSATSVPQPSPPFPSSSPRSSTPSTQQTQSTGNSSQPRPQGPGKLWFLCDLCSQTVIGMPSLPTGWTIPRHSVSALWPWSTTSHFTDQSETTPRTGFANVVLVHLATVHSLCVLHSSGVHWAGKASGVGDLHVHCMGGKI